MSIGRHASDRVAVGKSHDGRRGHLRRRRSQDVYAVTEHARLLSLSDATLRDLTKSELVTPRGLTQRPSVGRAGRAARPILAG